jgi:GMP synthase PP-ATPase subunit
MQVMRRLRDECGVDLHLVDASELFLSRLAGFEDPETKRKIIGVTFCEVRRRCPPSSCIVVAVSIVCACVFVAFA